MSVKVLSLGFLLIVTSVAPALAHPGGLDSKGGHFNRKTGEYHYHRKQPDPPAPAPAPAPVPAPTRAAAAVPAGAAMATAPPTLDQVSAALSNCMKIEDSTRRLWCFEGIANALTK